MNWLAHILLAGGRAEDQLGGVLADLVPMSVVRTLPAGLRRGVALHQSIDHYCDSHPAACVSNRRLTEAGIGLRPAAAGIAVDMLYDHLLAQTWAVRCPAVSLESFAGNFYGVVEAHENFLPSASCRAFRHMRTENWLVSYRELTEIRAVLERIRRRLSPRAAAVCPLASAVDVFVREREGFQADFERFWPQVVAHAATFLADADTGTVALRPF